MSQGTLPAGKRNVMAVIYDGCYIYYLKQHFWKFFIFLNLSLDIDISNKMGHFGTNNYI